MRWAISGAGFCEYYGSEFVQFLDNGGLLLYNGSWDGKIRHEFVVAFAPSQWSRIIPTEALTSSKGERVNGDNG